MARTLRRWRELLAGLPSSVHVREPQDGEPPPFPAGSRDTAVTRQTGAAARRAAAHYAGLRTDPFTGLKCCWVCARPMDPVLHANGFASHPGCDPDEISDRFPPEPGGRTRYG